MWIASSKLPVGQTLLEAVIAIGVLLTGVVGSLVLITTTINLGRRNEDRIVAQNLAQEGLELVYALRSDASLAKVQMSSITWDQYLYRNILKIGNKDYYLASYDLGTYNSATGVCQQTCDGTTTTNCTNKIVSDTSDENIVNSEYVNCDIQAFSMYLHGLSAHCCFIYSYCWLSSNFFVIYYAGSADYISYS